MGIYKRYEDVPDRYRLTNFASEYAGRDVYSEFMAAEVLAEERSDRYEQDYRRYGRRWREHVTDRGQHPALAYPADVEAWCEDLLSRYTVRTAFDHWTAIERFYTWLLTHTEHPHVYHPVWQAAARESATAGELWDKKMGRRSAAKPGGDS